jgi:hypothetical protein
MNHTFINWAMALAAVFVLGVLGPGLDPQDFESDSVKERREWLAHAKACQTKYGGLQASAEYDESGKLVCVTRRGEVLAHGGAR